MIYIEEEFTVEGDSMAQEITSTEARAVFGRERALRPGEHHREGAQEQTEPLKLELDVPRLRTRSREFPVSPAQALLNMEIARRRAVFTA